MKLSLRPWRAAPTSQILTALAVGFLLLLAGLLFWLQASLKPVVHRLQAEQVITAYLSPQIPPGEAEHIADSIRVSLGAHADPSLEVEYVGSSQFLQRLKKAYPELVREVEDLGAEGALLVPRYATVSGILSADAVEQVRKVQGVESAETSKDRFKHVVGAFSALRWVARLLLLGLALALLTGLIHLGRMNAHLHGEALSLLRFWGAGRLGLRTPGLVAGMSVGALGGMIAALAWVLGANWLGAQVRALSPLLREMPPMSVEVGMALALIGALCGAISGSVGAREGAHR